MRKLYCIKKKEEGLYELLKIRRETTEFNNHGRIYTPKGLEGRITHELRENLNVAWAFQDVKGYEINKWCDYISNVRKKYER